MSQNQTDFLARCVRLSACMWSDALDECRLSGVILDLPQRSGGHRFAGYAVTARHHMGPHGHCSSADLGVTQMLEATGRGQVLLVEMGGVKVSTFGGLAAATAVANGAEAVIIDGGCRDLGEIQATGLWVASRHVVPTSGKTRAKLVALGERATISGISVTTGDLVVGDETGIVIIPITDIQRVFEIAERKLAQDLQMDHALKAGRTFAEAASEAQYF